MRRACALAFSMLLAAGPAFAAGNDPAAAQALFDQGLSDFDEGKIDEACAKFQESMRLDPANGTLLNLARCHERQGKTATAWAEYKDVAALAARAGDEDRAAVAREAAERLAPTMSMLRIVVTKPVPGLVVMRDGVSLNEASWGQPLPVDPGRHRIAAIAPGWQTATLEIDVAPKDTQARVVVPELVPGKDPIGGPNGPAGTVGTEPRDDEGRALTIAGVVVGSVGISAAIAGSILGAMSLSELSEARDDPALCPNEVCTPRGRAHVDEAEVKGNASTGLFVAGGALVATGIVMIVVDLGFDDGKDEKTAVQVTPIVGPSDAGMSLKMAF